MGMKDTPIKVYNKMNKGRNPLAPDLPMMLDTEYTENMVKHLLPKKGEEPKLIQNKPKITPFEGNYQSVYQDYVNHPPNHKGKATRDCCHVTRPEMEEMVRSSAQRLIQEEPDMARQVFAQN